jgi:hypothetical protein
LQLFPGTGVFLNNSYIRDMTFRFAFLFVVTSLLLAGSSRGSAPTDNPYTPIVARNIFGLVPIPTNNPADQAPPATPPPKITPNGIMTLFGKLQVLFKVANPPKPGQPPKEDSYVLGVGERQDEIEVQKIDESAATIIFNNHGTVQELSLVSGVATGGGGAGLISAPVAFGGAQVSGVAPAMSAPSGFGGRFGRARDVSSANTAYGVGNLPIPASTGGINFGSRNIPATNSKQESPLTPEAEVIKMEVNRILTQDEVTQGKLPPLPPTVLTPPDATGVGGLPLIPPPPALPGQDQ